MEGNYNPFDLLKETPELTAAIKRDFEREKESRMYQRIDELNSELHNINHKLILAKKARENLDRITWVLITPSICFGLLTTDYAVYGSMIMISSFAVFCIDKLGSILVDSL